MDGGPEFAMWLLVMGVWSGVTLWWEKGVAAVRGVTGQVKVRCEEKEEEEEEEKVEDKEEDKEGREEKGEEKREGRVAKGRECAYVTKYKMSAFTIA